MKIIFLVPYPLSKSASQRFRFEQYIPILENLGFQIEVSSFMPSHFEDFFLESGNYPRSIRLLTIGFVRRLTALFTLKKYDFVFIHREVFPVGPPIFEMIIYKLLKKKIIYDFDDAIWLSDRLYEPFLFKVLKWRSKVSSICRWSFKISCGNHYLARYAIKYNNRVVCNPTTIDTERLHNPEKYRSETDKNTLAIGWTGSRSTLKYLNVLQPVIKRIQTEYPSVNFIVIADEQPPLSIDRITFIPWKKQTEGNDLMKIDIGIMPLPDDEWSLGKCGFKILQYMAFEIPAVASPIGVNNEIIQHGINGFLCTTADEWYFALKNLIDDKVLREQFGKRGRELVQTSYSIESNTSTFLSLFE